MTNPGSLTEHTDILLALFVAAVGLLFKSWKDYFKRLERTIDEHGEVVERSMKKMEAENAKLHARIDTLKDENSDLRERLKKVETKCELKNNC